ncbi:MAG: hypothetical protein NTV50_10605 [Planctomycetota bacterium]|nr:hypothetical protein [Planctomycetota bacterium]
MANGFPCPNQSCKHLFRIEEMQGVQSITCPSCKKSFAIRKPNKSTPVIAPKPPVANPPKNQNKIEEDQGLVFESKSEIKTNISTTKKTLPKKNKNSGLSLSQVFFLGIGMFFISVSFAAFYIIGLPLLKKEIKNDSVQQTEASPELIDSDFFTFKPLNSYTKDQKIAQTLQTKFAYTGKEKDLWLLYYKDFKTRNPTGTEMHQEMISRLKLFLPKSLEWEENAEGVEIGKVPFRKFIIEGTKDDSSAWVGDCYSANVNGVYFLILCLVPIDSKDLVQESWVKFNQGLAIKSNAKVDWKPTPRKTRLVTVEKLKMSFAAPESIWLPQDIKDYDTNPESVFIGKNASDSGDFLNQKAKLQVFALQNPIKDEKAWDMVEEKLFELLKEEKTADTKIEKYVDTKNKFPELKNKTITAKAENFTIKIDDQIQKLIFWGRYSSKNGSLLFLCEIPFKTKDYWLEEINDILQSLAMTE